MLMKARKQIVAFVAEVMPRNANSVWLERKLLEAQLALRMHCNTLQLMLVIEYLEKKSGKIHHNAYRATRHSLAPAYDQILTD